MDAFRTVARLDAVQPAYNLFERDIEADVLPLPKAQASRFWATARFTAAFSAEEWAPRRPSRGDDLRKVDPKFQGERFRQYLAAVDELKKLARDRFGKSVLALALRWVLDQGPTIAPWGARHPEQLDPIGDIDGWHIDEASRREIDAILKRCIKDPVSPEFMAPPLTRAVERELATAWESRVTIWLPGRRTSRAAWSRPSALSSESATTARRPSGGTPGDTRAPAAAMD
jgi:Aldo/keto reductase family